MTEEGKSTIDGYSVGDWKSNRALMDDYFIPRMRKTYTLLKEHAETLARTPRSLLLSEEYVCEYFTYWRDIAGYSAYDELEGVLHRAIKNFDVAFEHLLDHIRQYGCQSNKWDEYEGDTAWYCEYGYMIPPLIHHFVVASYQLLTDVKACKLYRDEEWEKLYKKEVFTANCIYEFTKAVYTVFDECYGEENDTKRS